MAETNRKDRTLIRFNSGSGVMFKLGATDWENLGECESAKLVRKADTNQAKFMSGDSLKKRGSREVSLIIVFSQNNQAVQERIDELLTNTLKCYIDNGLEGGKYQEYYFPEISPSENFDFEMGNSKQQSITLEFSVYPQDSNVSVTPDTDLPAAAHASGASPVTGKNPYYKVIDTAAA